MFLWCASKAKKLTSFGLFWKTNKNPTDYYSIEAVQGIFYQQVCTYVHMHSLSHTPSYLMWQETNVSVAIYIPRWCLQMCGLNIKWQGQLHIHLSPTSWLTHTSMSVVQQVFLMCLQYLTIDTQAQNVFVFLSWCNFILHYTLCGQNDRNSGRPRTVSQQDENQFLCRFYVPLDCFVFECFILSTASLTTGSVTDMQVQQTAKAAF